MRDDMASMDAVLQGLLSPGPPPSRRLPARDPLPFPRADGVDGLGVPTAARPAGLAEILAGRRSSLEYSERAVSTSSAVGMVSGALSDDRSTWGLEPAAGELEALVLAFRSTDWPTGAYLVTSSGARRIAGMDGIGPLDDLGIQLEFVTGAGIVAMYAHLDRAEGWAGAHGYRLSALRASMALYDFHLSCLGLGWAGTVFGGFIPSAVRRLAMSDGVTRHPLLAATYGLPPAAASGG